MVSQIGKYKVEKELGRGGFGQVYLALDRDIGRQVAIKVLLAEGDAEKLKRFQAEIGTTGNLRHKNIVTIYESGEEAGNPYLVMELLEGETLRDVIAKARPLSILNKVKIMNQVAEGLAHAHSKEVVHRDVKPENIMLLPDGTVKIMDFGIALAPNRIGTMTQTGFLVGTLSYMAPEQFSQLDIKANEQTDIFAFGNVYYELLTGRHPFIEIVKELGVRPEVAILSYDPAPVAGFVRDCPEALEQLVHRALSKNPTFRYKKFSEIVLYGQEIVVDLQHEQVVAIIAEASRLLESLDLEGARVKLQEVQQLEPWNLEARRLRDQADRLIRQAAIQQQVSELMAEADQRMAERRYHAAVQCLDSAARLDNTDETIRRRLAEAQARLNASVRAKHLIEEARSKEDQGQFSEALELLNAALDLEPGHPEAERLARRVGEKFSRDKDRRREDAIRAAFIHLAAKEYPEALAVLDAIERDQPGFSELAELRAHIIREEAAEERHRRAERFQAAIAKTQDTMHSGDLERAAEMIALLSAHFGDEPGAAEALGILRDRWTVLKNVREIGAYRQQCQELIERKAFPEAMELLATALRRYPEDPTLQELKQSAAELWDAHRQQQRYAEGLDKLLREARETIAAGRYSEVIERLDSAGEYAGSAEVRALRASAVEAAAVEAEKAFVRQLLAAAEDAKSPEDREQALADVERGLARYPRNTELANAANLLQRRVEQDRQRLAEDLARRRVYEAALLAGERHRGEGNLEAAELALTPVLPGAPDRRAAEMLEAIQVLRWEAQRLEAARREAERLEIERLAAAQSKDVEPQIQETVEISQVAEGPKIEPVVVPHAEAVATPRIAGSAIPRQPAARIPWRAIATVAASAVAIAGIAVMAYKLSHKTPDLTPFEIRSDPQGASVKLGDRSCLTPNCRFNLAPGQYQIHAQLDGFEPVEQMVTVDAGKNPAFVELTLKPVAPPPAATPHTGTLVVRTGQPAALVSIDDKPIDRTGAGGVVSLSLEARTYRVAVEKDRYNVSPASREVVISENGTQTVEFNLVPKDARLVLTGAPAGVEVRAGNKLLGRSSGSRETAFPVSPGPQTLQFSAGGASKKIERLFQPDETARIAWRDVAPATPVPPTKDPQPTFKEPTPEEKEAADWGLVRNSSDASAIRAFLGKHPGGAHRSEAQSLLDKLTAPPPVVDERPLIRAALEQYIRSIQAKDENQLKEAWPQMPTSELDKWRTDFQNTKEIRIQPLNQPTYDIANNTARVEWRLQTEKSYASTSKPYMGDHNTRFSLRKENGRWMIQSVR